MAHQKHESRKSAVNNGRRSKSGTVAARAAARLGGHRQRRHVSPGACSDRRSRRRPARSRYGNRPPAAAAAAGSITCAAKATRSASIWSPIRIRSRRSWACRKRFTPATPPRSTTTWSKATCRKRAVAKLLAERPNLKGIALPGMPEGSPGMDGVARHLPRRRLRRERANPSLRGSRRLTTNQTAHSHIMKEIDNGTA